jgi:hypothetical protein
MGTSEIVTDESCLHQTDRFPEALCLSFVCASTWRPGSLSSAQIDLLSWDRFAIWILDFVSTCRMGCRPPSKLGIPSGPCRLSAAETKSRLAGSYI